MKYVIIGSSVAALKACEAIRQHDIDGSVFLCSQTDNFDGIYDHQRLHELLSDETADIYIATRAMIETAGVQVIDVPVAYLDMQTRQVTFVDDSQLEFDRLLLAMDAVPTQLNVTGSDLNGVQTFWDIADVENLREQLNNFSVTHAAILTRGIDVYDGDGVPGLVVARALREVGVPVTFITSQPEIGIPLLVSPLAQALQQQLDELGIEVLCSVEVKEMVGNEFDHLQHLLFDNQQTVEASNAVISVGVEADLSLLQPEIFDMDKGVRVNELLETDYDGVYAAGYVSEQDGYVVRTQEQVAEQGTIAGLNMTGANRPYSARHSELYTALEEVPFRIFDRILAQ